MVYPPRSIYVHVHANCCKCICIEIIVVATTLPEKIHVESTSASNLEHRIDSLTTSFALAIYVRGANGWMALAVQLLVWQLAISGMAQEPLGQDMSRLIAG